MDRINVLDKGWVELQDIMGDDLAIVNAARVSFLGESKGAEKDARLLHRLWQDKHTSPFEMVEFKFRLKAPVVVFWQWTRHRTWSYSGQSGRYTEFEENDFYIPDVWRRQSTSNKQGSSGELDDDLNSFYDEKFREMTHLLYGYYEQAIADGVAKEQARLFLPAWASYYTFIAKVDAHNLMKFLTLRTAPDAQWEIRQYALAIELIFKERLPVTYQAWKS